MHPNLLLAIFMKYSKNYYQIKSNNEIFDMINSERETVGYYNLPNQDTNEINKYASTIKNKNIIVLGIGGSSLGAKAIYEFLRPPGHPIHLTHFKRGRFSRTDRQTLKFHIKINRLQLN